MRKNLLPFLCSYFICLLLNERSAGQDRFAFAITDVSQNTASWTVLRQLNFETGIYSDVLLYGTNPKQIAYDATTRQPIDPNALHYTSAQAFATGVAAIAYDKKNNRIYYTPMFIDELRYIDLNTMKVYYATGRPFTGNQNTTNDNAKVVSRMVIAPDGYGYAITNDGTSFVRFTTGESLAIDQLGTLVDDPANTGMSVHNACSSAGGDIIADDAGNLLLVSASNNVFRININSKVATWLGPMKGIPAGFTSNGAVVTDDGKLLVGSQVFSKSWYVVDPKSLQASEFNTPKGVYLTSDLANSNYLATRPKTKDIAIIPLQNGAASGKIQLYPNPISISDNQFKIQFNKLRAGDYTIVLTDVAGKEIMMQKVSVVNDRQIQTINLKKNTAQGIYLVKITDIRSKSVFTQKLVVQ